MMVTLKNSVPCVNEHILWSMPYYEKEGTSISFSACKKHISLYVGVEAIGEFASELNEFVTKNNEVFDMIELDIALEEHGLPCFIE